MMLALFFGPLLSVDSVTRCPLQAMKNLLTNMTFDSRSVETFQRSLIFVKMHSQNVLSHENLNNSRWKHKNI